MTTTLGVKLAGYDKVAVSTDRLPTPSDIEAIFSLRVLEFNMIRMIFYENFAIKYDISIN